MHGVSTVLFVLNYKGGLAKRDNKDPLIVRDGIEDVENVFLDPIKVGGTNNFLCR